MKYLTYKKNNINKQKGFTLLLSVIITGILLLISFVISNVALKQLLLTYAGGESQQAFYAANSGVECAVYWDVKNPTAISAFSTSSAPSSISCDGDTISGMGGGGVINATSTFTITFQNGTCATVKVGKQANGNTRIESRGYNVCGSSSRKFERGVTITY